MLIRLRDGPIEDCTYSNHNDADNESSSPNHGDPLSNVAIAVPVEEVGLNHFATDVSVTTHFSTRR